MSLNALTSKLIFFCLVVGTFQVNIELIGRQYDGYSLAICNRHPPGICCRVPDITRNGPWELGAHRIIFEHLLPGDIAAVFEVGPWVETGWTGRDGHRYSGCSSRVLETGHGPGTFEVANRQGQMGGASYISLGEVVVPPDSKTVSLLNFQGVLGLVWGGGQWFASAAAQSKYGANLKIRRGIRSALEGTAFVRGPSRWHYPNLIQINGTNYTNDDTSSVIYKAPDGLVLNLTMPSLP